MAAAAVDVGYLAASYSVAETSVHSLLSEPTVELVQSLLIQIEARAREYDDLKSEKLRAEVELEGAVHNSDARARTLKATADNAVKDTEELRQKLVLEGKCKPKRIDPILCRPNRIPHAETARQQVEAQLQSLKTSATGSTSQVHTLESRVKTLEAQNRDAVALHEAKSAAHDRLAEELSTQHQKFVTLRKQVSELEEKNQSLETAATSVKFRESNFQQEIELLRKNNEWFETELKTRAADNTKFRKEKNAQIAELQRVGAEASQTIDALRSKEAMQSKRIEELEQRVEQSLSRVQQLQEEARQNQDSFRAELDNARRLAALHQESANTVKKRLQEVQDQLTAMGDQAAEEVGHLQAEVESERNKSADYETKVAELESLLENQETQLTELRNASQVPATPRRAMNGNFDTPGRAGSPMSFSPGGSRLKGGLSMTQLYTENTKLKADVRALQEQNEKRSTTLNEMLEELEAKVPEMHELKDENERLHADLEDHSLTLNEALQQKEAALKQVRKYQGDYEGLVRQSQIDREQLRDATFQNKVLLYRHKVLEDGLESLSQEEAQFLEETVANQIPDHLLDEEDTATSRLLSKHLVLFQNVKQVVDQNTELLRTIREVAQQYEGSEAQEKSAKNKQDQEELLQLRDKLAQYEAEIDSLKLRSQSFMKERDMYRRIVTSRGHGTTPAFGESVGDGAPGTPNFGDSVTSVAQSKESELIKELQTRLDTVKEEYATDRTTCKQQIDGLEKENRQLQGDNHRLNHKQEMFQERYDLLQHKISTLEAERSELRKQYASLNDQFAKTDTQRQQEMENLIEAKSQLDSLDRENINLKASQSLWKTIEARLTEDRNMLIEDKSRLNKIINDMQTLRNEHDLTEAQNRRNLQARADGLEAELQNTRRKLDEETEDHKKLSMRYEWDQTEKQRKIDDLVKAANEVRQELASVKSTRDQLQTRVNELQIEVRNAQERIQVQHAQHIPRGNASDNADEESLSREEQLTNQLAELQRKHDRAQEDLVSANAKADDLQNIAQGAEDRVLEVEEAAEKLQHEFDENLAEISRLREQVEEISNELTAAKTELSELRSGQSQEILQLTQQQQSLEADVSRLTEEVNECKVEVESKTQDVTAQAEIANRAQQDYENELRKHGETMNNLRTVRAERDQFSGEIMQYKTQAEAASATLAQNEDHWTTTREQYERELAEARTRYTQQEESNKTLYGQYDTLNAQIASLKSEQLSVAAGQNDNGSLDSSLNGLQSLNKILRDDKDVLQLQMNAKELELQRVRQELTHKEEQLDRANEKLIADQSQASSRPTGVNHQALQQSIGQLNVYRESNTTLRNEKNRLEAERDDMARKIEALNDEIAPLKARVSDLEGELEINTGHVKNLEEDRDRWQKRHQDVLLRYDRIDPKELEDMKTKLADLQTERDQAIGSVDERIQAARDEEKAIWEERKNNIVASAKNKAKTDGERRREIIAERDQVAAERDQATAECNLAKTELEQVQEKLTSTQSELESVRQARDEAVEKMNAKPDLSMNEEGQINEEGTSFTATEKNELEARVAAAEDRSNRESDQSATLGLELDTLKGRQGELETQIVSQNSDDDSRIEMLTTQQAELENRIGLLNNEIHKANVEKTQAEHKVEELQSGRPSTQPPPMLQSSEIDELKEKLAAASKEAEDLRARAAMPDATAEQNSDDRVRSLTDQLVEQAQHLASIQATLQDREEALAKVEQELIDFKAKTEAESAHAAEQKEKFRTKANEKIKGKLEEIKGLEAQLQVQAKTIENLTMELGGLKSQQPQSQSTSQNVNIPDSTAFTGSVSLPGPDSSERQIQDWISNNQTAQAIIKRNINKIRAEQGKKEEASPAVKAEQEKGTAEQASEDTISKEDHLKILTKKEEDLQAAFTKKEDMALKKTNLQVNISRNNHAKVKAKWDVVEKAAKETPEKPVKEVYEAANAATPASAPSMNSSANVQPATPQAPQATQPLQPTPQQIPSSPATAPASNVSAQQQQSHPLPAAPAFNTPSHVQQQQQAGQQAPMGGLPQANGARPNNFGQSANYGQPAFGGPMHPYSQSYPNNSMPNSFGYGSLPQPNFTNPQNQFMNNQNPSRSNSPFGQQPQYQQPQFQQGGRGHNDAGTGPAALRGLGQPTQSGIPRVGSNIPMPAGGRGRGGPQQQQHPGQNPGPPGVGQSQIGRGGGRGGGGGRGRGGQPSSPMNPGAPQFQPTGGNGGAGRGQKRGAEDDGGGSQRGGKRPRGGRGGGLPGAGGGEE
jgi:nucleoprotein TPR